MKDSDFLSKMNGLEIEAWLGFTDVVEKFLGNKKVSDFRFM